MGLRLQLVSPAELAVAWTSPTYGLYGHRVWHPRAASFLPPTQRSRESALSATRDLVRRRQGRLEERFEKKHGYWRGFVDSVVSCDGRVRLWYTDLIA